MTSYDVHLKITFLRAYSIDQYFYFFLAGIFIQQKIIFLLWKFNYIWSVVLCSSTIKDYNKKSLYCQITETEDNELLFDAQRKRGDVLILFWCSTNHLILFVSPFRVTGVCNAQFQGDSRFCILLSTVLTKVSIKTFTTFHTYLLQ